MQKTLVNAILFCAILLAVLCLLDLTYSKILASRSLNKVSWIFNKHNENYDFAVLGDSRVLTCIDVKAMEHYSQLKGINLGTSGSRPVENYLVLSRFLKTNKLKMVLLQLDATIGMDIVSPNNDKLPFYGTYAYMPYIHDSDVFDIISEYTSPIKYLPWAYVPFIRYAEFNNEYNPAGFLKGNDTSMDEAGYEKLTRKARQCVSPDSLNPTAKVDQKDIDSFTRKNLSWVKKIIALCKANNIQLAIFTSPVHRVEFLGPLTANSISRINELSFQTGIPYWDWSKMYFNSPDSVFADSFHTNYWGADEIARVAADSLLSFRKRILYQ